MSKLKQKKSNNFMLPSYCRDFARFKCFPMCTFVCALCFAHFVKKTSVHASHIKAAFLCKCFSSVLTSDKLPGNILRNSSQSTCILVNFIGISMEVSPASTWRTPTVRWVGGRAAGAKEEGRHTCQVGRRRAQPRKAVVPLQEDRGDGRAQP